LVIHFTRPFLASPIFVNPGYAYATLSPTRRSWCEQLISAAERAALYNQLNGTAVVVYSWLSVSLRIECRILQSLQSPLFATNCAHCDLYTTGPVANNQRNHERIATR